MGLFKDSVLEQLPTSGSLDALSVAFALIICIHFRNVDICNI